MSDELPPQAANMPAAKTTAATVSTLLLDLNKI
jgi:hypothetical protein